MVSDTPIVARRRQETLHTQGIIWSLLLVLSAIPVFWMGFASLGKAWLTPEYSHGPLIPLISLYLFLRELRDKTPLPAGTPIDTRPGVVIVLLALGCGLLGNIIAIPDLVTYAFILWIAGVVLVRFGWAEGKRHQLPVLHLIFMLPLPNFLYWQLTIFLQSVSSEIGVWVIKTMGIPVYLDGNIIDLGPFKLQVAEACSGLRYLFPILSFSYLIAILYRGPYAHKALLFAMAAPLTVLMNAFRIGMIGVLVNFYGITQAEGFLHLFEGWLIFGACVAILLLVAVALQQLTLAPKSLAETIDLDFHGLSAKINQLLDVRVSRGWIAASLLTCALSIAFVLAPRTAPPAPLRDAFALYPSRLDTWVGTPLPLAPETEKVLGASDYLSRLYTTGGAEGPIHFFAAWYHSQTEGQGIHSPEVCLPAGGWEIFSFEQQQLSMPNTSYGTFTANRAVIEKGLERQILYYWFEQRGQRITNDFSAKLSVLRDSLTRGRADGALVRFSTPIAHSETETQAEARLQAFMAKALVSLPGYIPE